MKQHITEEQWNELSENGKDPRQNIWARRWYLKNKDKVEYKARRYKANKKWVERNRDRVNEIHREWKKNNPTKIAHIKARRYAKEKGAEGSHTANDWRDMKASHEYKCVLCGSYQPFKMTKDHIIPLSKGGSDYIENIQPLCKSCNCRKKDR